MGRHWQSWRLAVDLTSVPVVLSLVMMGAAAVDRPLIDAARSTDREAIRRLVQEKVDVNAAEPDGTTALHWASYRDDGESADLLIKAGANVNAANDLGATPLWTASLNGSADDGAAAAPGGSQPQRRSSAW